MARYIVKIFGERNTGTRAMRDLLSQVEGVQLRLGSPPDHAGHMAAVQAAVETQLDGRWRKTYLHAIRDELAVSAAETDPWKHAAPRLSDTMRAAGLNSIHMVRDPYSWLIALARRPYHIKGPNAETLAGFAARPWMTEAREGLPRVVLSPATLWAMKARAHLRFQAEAREAGLGCEIIRFEDFIQASAMVAGDAFARLGLPPTELEARAENTKPGEPGLDVLRRYYAEERWQSWLTVETVTRVNAHIDWNYAEALGYRRREPSDYPAQLPEEVEAQMREEMRGLTVPSDRETGSAPAT